MIIAFFAYVNKAIKSYLLYRRTRYELGRLSSRDLQDLGIARGDIDFIARKTSYGELRGL